MSDYEGGGGCCRCCFSITLTLGLTALFMWLSLRSSNPVCSIQFFYVPALNKSANSTSNHTVYLDLKLDNENKDKGIYYDALNLTLYYVDATNVRLPVANYTLPRFYQGQKKNARRRNLTETYGVPWDAALAAVANGSSKAIFRVGLSTAVRFKVVGLKTKRHRLVVGADVEVNDGGKKVKKKGIRLKSGVARYRAPVLLLVAAFISFLSFL